MPTVEYLFPPQAYLAECERTVFKGETYGEAIEQLIKVTTERDLCASQIEGIRKWQEKIKSGKNKGVAEEQ